VDKDQWLTAAVLAVLLIGLPVSALVFVCRSAEPKDRKLTDRETYPDEHLGI
jgi:hypothetical protein